MATLAGSHDKLTINLTKFSYIQNSRHEGLHDENNKKLQCFILSNLIFCRITTPSDFPNEKH